MIKTTYFIWKRYVKDKVNGMYGWPENKGWITPRVKSEKETQVSIAALQGKGYSAAVGLDGVIEI